MYLVAPSERPIPSDPRIGPTCSVGGRPRPIVSYGTAGRSTRGSEEIIPIYEYSCQACGTEFEALVRGEGGASCPSCESSDVERLFSLPTVHSSTTHEMAMRAARARDKKQGEERMRVQREYELNHDDH